MTLLGRIFWFLAFVALTGFGKLIEWAADHAEERVLARTKRKKPPAPDEDDDPDDEDEDA